MPMKFRMGYFNRKEKDGQQKPPDSTENVREMRPKLANLYRIL